MQGRFILSPPQEEAQTHESIKLHALKPDRALANCKITLVVLCVQQRRNNYQIPVLQVQSQPVHMCSSVFLEFTIPKESF
jgi:hypothetical protein